MFYFYNIKDYQGNIRQVVQFDENGNQQVIQSTDYYPSGTVVQTSTGQWEQPYKYNGKELIRMHGLDWYDYGARNYEPVLSRFTTMDPLAEKYYSISPYAYCAGNPVMFVDPTGMWIQYSDGSGNYRYENEQWMRYNKEGKHAGKYTPFTPESGSFMEGVLQALNTLNQNYTVNQILSFFANDENTATIMKSGPNENYENKADIENSATGAIYISEKLEGSDIPTPNGVLRSPLWLDLGHELAHRQDVLKNGYEQANKL